MYALDVIALYIDNWNQTYDFDSVLGSKLIEFEEFFFRLVERINTWKTLDYPQEFLDAWKLHIYMLVGGVDIV